MSDPPLTVEQRALSLAAELWDYAEAAPYGAIATITEHLQAAIADAVKGERARIVADFRNQGNMLRSIIEPERGDYVTAWHKFADYIETGKI